MKGVSQCSSGAALMNSYTPLEKFLSPPFHFPKCARVKYYISNSDLQLERAKHNICGTFTKLLHLDPSFLNLKRI